ncbi:uncharacterized protein LOC143426658 [Xylocopa sonorina]|uniref:uncharacterized protein LOC143426658 n=1 Tax=Xylocopa sonorina TaxID=1818115 RepID=UPI00403B0ECF
MIHCIRSCVLKKISGSREPQENEHNCDLSAIELLLVHRVLRSTIACCVNKLQCFVSWVQPFDAILDWLRSIVMTVYLTDFASSCSLEGVLSWRGKRSVTVGYFRRSSTKTTSVLQKLSKRVYERKCFKPKLPGMSLLFFPIRKLCYRRFSFIRIENFRNSPEYIPTRFVLLYFINFKYTSKQQKYSFNRKCAFYFIKYAKVKHDRN